MTDVDRPASDVEPGGVRRHPAAEPADGFRLEARHSALQRVGDGIVTLTASSSG